MEEERPNTSAGEETREAIREMGVLPVGNARDKFYCVTVIGQVEGHTLADSGQKCTKYDHLIPLLVSLEQDDAVEGILILLNTLGGDVEAGLAMAEVIASLDTPTVSVVLGGGHSIGVPLAVAAKRSFIVPSATMTVHPVRTSGMILGVSQSFDYLEKMQNRILRFIASHSNASEEELRARMLRTDELANDIGSVLEGEEAVRLGLIDAVGGISDALRALRDLSRA
ncbi:MAG: ATP-dependent Clp protease proteolytic subunit [Clostridia bacterium]|nr:ATP-dependent Clp protease proteolytic subunit [Clostridia bacterium]